MTEIRNELKPITHKRKVFFGVLMLGMSMVCVVMTILFLYVSSTANRRVEEIRRISIEAADRREAKVDQLAQQVSMLQHKLEAIPNRTAEETADKIKQVEPEAPPVKQ